jgi:hypothetical protein
MHIDVSQVTLYLALWGAIGPLVGILVGHLLSRSSQRRQWVLDRRHEEFQELIKGFDASMLSEATHWDSSMELTPEERRDKARKTSDFFEIVRTRIFTVADIKQLDLEREWRIAVALFRQNSDGRIFERTYSTLMEKLVHVATSPKVREKR